MTAPSRPRLELPRSTRRYRFSFTALADAMFQLLIFFMLSANLTPYSLLTVQTGTLAGGAGSDTAGPATTAGAVADPLATAVWTVNADSIVAGGQRFGPEQIPALAEALSAQKTAGVLLVARNGASVQIVVSIIEALAQHGVTSVRIADGSI